MVDVLTRSPESQALTQKDAIFREVGAVAAFVIGSLQSYKYEHPL